MSSYFYELVPTLLFHNRSPRARRGQFLGFSKHHSTQIGLIRNLRSGSITPQYHVAYDDLFTTVTNESPGGTSQEQQIKDWTDIIIPYRRSRCCFCFVNHLNYIHTSKIKLFTFYNINYQNYYLIFTCVFNRV